MGWIVFKSGIHKIWIWLKTYWQIPFLFFWTILVYVMTRRNTDALVEVIEVKKESYRKQLEVLRKSHEKELFEKSKLLEEYEKTLEKVEKEFIKNEKELTDKQKNEIREVVVKSKGNPDEIKKKIEKEFGIKFVE